MKPWMLSELKSVLDCDVPVEAEITCPTSGVVFFALKKPLTTEHEVAFKVIRRLHGGCL